MPTENTSLKNTAPAGDFNTTNAMVIGKTNTYQRTFLIVAGSLLALLVVIAVAGTRGGQHLQSSAYEITKGAVALADYQVDSANLALTKDIFGSGVVSENEEGKHICCDTDYYSGCCVDGTFNGSTGICCNAIWCDHCDCGACGQNSCIACLDGRKCCDRVTKAWSYHCCAN